MQRDQRGRRDSSRHSCIEWRSCGTKLGHLMLQWRKALCERQLAIEPVVHAHEWVHEQEGDQQDVVSWAKDHHHGARWFLQSAHAVASVPGLKERLKERQELWAFVHRPRDHCEARVDVHPETEHMMNGALHPLVEGKASAVAVVVGGPKKHKRSGNAVGGVVADAAGHVHQTVVINEGEMV